MRFQYRWTPTSAPGSSESNKNVLVTANGVLEGSIGQVGNAAGRSELFLGLDTSLLGDEGGQSLEVTSTIVLCWLVTLAIEPLQCRETLDTKTLAQRPFGIGINLGNLDILGELEGVGELLIDRGKVLAMATPWGEELDEGGLPGLEDDFVEVARDKVEDGRLRRDNSREASEHEALEENHGGDVVPRRFAGWGF